MNKENLLSGADVTIRDAIRKIDANTRGILFIIDESGKLIGVATDGDIRRWILKNGSLNEKIEAIMNREPIFLRDRERDSALEKMKKYSVKALPVLTEANEIREIVFFDDLVLGKKYTQKISAPVVIMAGGKGTRLYPYTKILPKPLIPIGDTPIVERIIQKFRDFGCSQFYMTVNYKKNMIKSYFLDVEKNYNLEYIEEDLPLGTAGGLSLFQADMLSESFFVSNCDILIEADYSDIYNFHKKNKNKLTVVASLKKHVIPYGVICIDEKSSVLSIDEKPENHFLVNTGMYLVEPEVLDLIPKRKLYHMTELMNDCLSRGFKVGAYSVTEDAWMDMGEIKEMDIMIEKIGLNK